MRWLRSIAHRCRHARAGSLRLSSLRASVSSAGHPRAQVTGGGGRLGNSEERAGAGVGMDTRGGRGGPAAAGVGELMSRRPHQRLRPCCRRGGCRGRRGRRCTPALRVVLCGDNMRSRAAYTLAVSV
jgi:hypothetical protein